MSKKIILVIEDDLVLGEVIRKRVEDAGYICMLQNGGEQGLIALRAVRPNLVLLDLLMPGKTGFDVLSDMSVDPNIANIPVIVISNSGKPSDIEQALNLGVKDFVVKAHFSPEDIIVKIANVLGTNVEADEITPVESGHPDKRAQAKVLIIEDDTILSDIAADRFRFGGYLVEKARDGESGLAIAQSFMPDIILLDIVMPGLSGFDVLRQLKDDTRTKDIPVMIFSNLAQDRDLELAKRMGAIEYLVKANYTPAQVVERVHKILEARK